MGIPGRELWKSGVVFELRGPSGSAKVFSLPFPPESFRVQVPQRVNRTKTFGGTFEDDYGLDNQKISLAGSMSGTDEWSYMSGEAAVRGTSLKASGPKILFAFLDQVVQYKRRIEVSELSKYSFRVYFLWASKLGWKDGAVQEDDVIAVECSLDDFEYSQDQSTPYKWNYKLELFVYRQLGDFILAPSNGSDFLRDQFPASPMDVIASAKTAMATLNDLKQAVRGVSAAFDKAIADCVGAVQQGVDLVNSWTSIPAFLVGQVFDGVNTVVGATGQVLVSGATIGTSILNSTSSTLGQINNTGDALRSLFQMPGTISKGAKTAFAEVQVQFDKLRSSYDFTPQTIDPFTTFGFYALNDAIARAKEASQAGGSTPPNLADKYAGGSSDAPSDDAYTALFLGLNADTRDAMNDWIDKLMRIETPGIVLTSENSAPYHVTGVNSVPVASGDTFESLSLKYFGTVDMGYLIAILNNLTSLDQLPLGQTILVPDLGSGTKDLFNHVYGDNPLGTDLLIDPNTGDLSIGGTGDVGLVAGTENLAQALNSRINTEEGTYIRNLAFGLKVDPTGISSVMAANIKDAIMQDPRVKAISEFQMRGKESALDVFFEATYSLGQTTPVAGAITNG